jgi:phage portal protein BeeE
MNVVLPYARVFEAAMERSLLTDEDQRSGIIIRFNLDAALRGDFKSRQEGLKIQREMGIINPNDWREEEGRNPISEDDGGEAYWMKGPSGQGEETPAEPEAPAEPGNDAEADGTQGDDDTDA